jgi:hypothetical protein
MMRPSQVHLGQEVRDGGQECRHDRQQRTGRCCMNTLLPCFLSHCMIVYMSLRCFQVLANHISFVACLQAPTVIPPGPYKRRFRDALNQYFMICPAPAAHLHLTGPPYLPLRRRYLPATDGLQANNGGASREGAPAPEPQPLLGKLGHVVHSFGMPMPSPL